MDATRDRSLVGALQVPVPHKPRSPISSPAKPSSGSTHYSHPLPVGPGLSPANGHSNIDLNDPPQPSLGSTDYSHPLGSSSALLAKPTSRVATRPSYDELRRSLLDEHADTQLSFGELMMVSIWSWRRHSCRSKALKDLSTHVGDGPWIRRGKGY